MPTGIGLNGYLNSQDAIVLRDWQHAARLYVDDVHRLSPKPKWLFYAVFNINDDALGNTSFRDQNKAELNYLVKKMDLPKYTLNVENLNQYNRKTTSYTRITYEPVNLTFHDDNNGVTNALWALYYGYYFADRFNSASPYTETDPPAYKLHAYDRKENFQFRYGLDTKAVNPFFRSIQLLTLSKHKFTSYLLCHPKITSWQHDTMDQSEGNGIVENQMSLAYDAVIYSTGTIAYDNPTGFSKLHYDQAQSPLGPDNIAILQGSELPEAYNLYADNTFNPIDTAIGMLSTFREAGFYGNQRPYGYGQSILDLQNVAPYTTSGLQNYSFSSSATESAAFRDNNYRPYVRAPIDESFTTGAADRTAAINDQFSAVLKSTGPNPTPIISDAFTPSLPRTSPTATESAIFSNYNFGKQLPETIGPVDINYFSTNDISNNTIVINELINNSPNAQVSDLPEDPFE